MVCVKKLDLWDIWFWLPNGIKIWILSISLNCGGKTSSASIGLIQFPQYGFIWKDMKNELNHWGLGKADFYWKSWRSGTLSSRLRGQWLDPESPYPLTETFATSHSSSAEIWPSLPGPHFYFEPLGSELVFTFCWLLPRSSLPGHILPSYSGNRLRNGYF